MTIKDAIFVLNCVEARGICIEAKNMAIKSLEAWEKIKEDIRLFNGLMGVGDYPYISKSDALIIIDKHLSEVENGLNVED